MNLELGELLCSAGWLPPEGIPIEQCMVMVRNYGFVPSKANGDQAPYYGGFHLILFERGRMPAYYVRCNGVQSEKFRRECEIAELLTRHAALNDVLIPARSASSKNLRVLLSQYVDARDLGECIEQRDVRDLASLISNAFSARILLADTAGALLGESRGRKLSLLAEAHDALDPVVHKLGGADLSGIYDFLKSVDPVPMEVQHSDFWPRNVIISAGRLKIIDLEEFGTVRVPLYDFFHFVQSMARPTNDERHGAWFGEDLAPILAELSVSFRRILQAEIARNDLSVNQIKGCFLFYVAKVASHRLRPGVPAIYSEALVKDLEKVSKCTHNDGVLLGPLLGWLLN